MALVNLDNDIPEIISYARNFIFRPTWAISPGVQRCFETGTAEVVNNEPGTGNDWVNMQTPASEQAQFISFRVDEQGRTLC